MVAKRDVSALRKIRFLLFAFVLSSSAGFGTLSAQAVAENSPPRIVKVGTALYAGIAYVTGYVLDDDDDTEGWSVFIGGDISGVATVGADGKFWFRASYIFPYGEGQASTQDPHGALSNTVYFEFQE